MEKEEIGDTLVECVRDLLILKHKHNINYRKLCNILKQIIVREKGFENVLGMIPLEETAKSTVSEFLTNMTSLMAYVNKVRADWGDNESFRFTCAGIVNGSLLFEMLVDMYATENGLEFRSILMESISEPETFKKMGEPIFNEFVNSWFGYLHKKTTWKLIIPLYGLSLYGEKFLFLDYERNGKPYELVFKEGVKIRKLSLFEYLKIKLSLWGNFNIPFKPNLVLERALWVVELTPEIPEMSEGLIEKVIKDAENEILPIITSLRIANPYPDSYDTLWTKIIVLMSPSPTEKDEVYLFTVFDLPSKFQKADVLLFPMPTLIITDTKKVIEIYKLLTTSPIWRDNKYQIAIRRFNMVYTREKLEDKILDLAIALEALFSKGPGDLRYKVSLRLSRLLENNPENREKIFEKTKKFYSQRSSIVHGRRTEVNEHEIKEIANYVKQAIYKFAELSKTQNMKHVSDILKYIDHYL